MATATRRVVREIPRAVILQIDTAAEATKLGVAAYHDGEISNLICSCFCSYICKHEFAAMLQLRETLELIEKHYAALYEQSGYFAAVSKGTLFAFAIDGKEIGSFTL